MYKPIFNKRTVIVFRQFRRKGYALFSCLGREVVISVLSVATLSATRAANGSDEVWRTDTAQVAREVWLGDVGVTGSRAPLTKSQAARMVTVLSREDIAQAPVQSVNDLLKYAVGVDVRQRGALGSQTDISIRGGTQEQITVLLNGINICDPQTGHNVMDLPVQLDEIVRIEVLEGPAGRAYGTSSLVGAINIVTSPVSASADAGTDTNDRCDVRLEGGSFGYAKAAFVARHSSHLSPPSSHLSHQVSGGYSRSDGYSRSKAGSLNTDYSGSRAFYQGAYDDDMVLVKWYAGIADKGWGSSTFYATPRWQADDQYEHTTKLLTAVQAETKTGALRLMPNVYWQQHRDRYEGYRGRPDVMKFNYNRSNVYGLSLNSYFDWAAGRTAFGAELRNEDLESGNLGERRDGTDVAERYNRGINRTNISAHLEHNVLLRRLTLSAGFVAAKSSQSNMHMTLYPGIDASYRAGDRWKFFAGWNTSLRLPSFTEMYYKLQGYAADPHLKPEEMQAVEGGAQYTSGAVQAKATLYHHHGRNMIDWVMDTSKGDAAVWQSVNHTRINSYGVETQLALALHRLLPWRLPPTSLHLSYSYISQDKVAEPDIVSQYALEYLRHKLVATLQTTLWRRLDLRIGLRWQDRVGTYTDFAGAVCDYRPFVLADVHLQWRGQRCTVFAQANNVLNNTRYVEYGNVPQPGRWLTAGVKLQIK